MCTSSRTHTTLTRADVTYLCLPGSTYTYDIDDTQEAGVVMRPK